ncbi:MAG: type II toxin-antitoxin system VapC family toxin [Treponema sp.]|nr:type II toxin-antitoxin system VapC family toxin [Treponema sp.]
MTNLLLDTNVLLWIFWDDERINSIKELISSKEVDVFVSIVSLWEILIKVRKEKLNISIDELSFFMKKHDFFELSLNSSYLSEYQKLPKFHKDPYDHMLLAQAITCPMRLITGDAELAQYSSLVMVI